MQNVFDDQVLADKAVIRHDTCAMPSACRIAASRRASWTFTVNVHVSWPEWQHNHVSAERD